MNLQPSEMTHEEFLEMFGPVFEHSPWIAERVWEHGVEFRHDTIAGMHQALCNEIRRAGRDEQLELLRAHPELAVQVGAGELTGHSRREQRGAGLDRCTESEYAEFQRLNQAYREKFGFPFIVAVKGYQRGQILEVFRTRLAHVEEEEFQAALHQVMRIGLFRLQEIFE
ncbi:2-oxo-4-hydroxy-4-carboxy-5-ureidoimidazoline decarboxylase [Elongatibacter sediminis]|uniref:2-oxo-4-hydroxy-4-carboxy-5-ureidoimidazoline decarboxylase n=1 Tax=Elongatibacter sediminis TaxID=3119006 RepID=A0AAW9RJW9_9GAMM